MCVCECTHANTYIYVNKVYVPRVGKRLGEELKGGPGVTRRWGCEGGRDSTNRFVIMLT